MSFVCVICEEYLSFKDSSVRETSDSRQINTTQCGHVFHASCLNDWFAAQKRKLSEGYNPQPRVPSSRSTSTCPSCQRQLNPTECLRIFPTEENTLNDSITPVFGVKTKADLNKEISELKEKIRQMEINSQNVETDLMNSLQNMSIEKESVDFAYRQLQMTLSERINSSGSDHARSTKAIADTDVVAATSSSVLTATASALPDLEAAGFSQAENIIPILQTEGGLKLDDKVVWLHGDNTEVGRVLWLGEIDGSILAGIEFVNPIGNPLGIPMINGRKAFTCRLEFGRMVPVKELILYADYHGCDNEPIVLPRLPAAIPSPEYNPSMIKMSNFRLLSDME